MRDRPFDKQPFDKQPFDKLRVTRAESPARSEGARPKRQNTIDNKGGTGTVNLKPRRDQA